MPTRCGSPNDGFFVASRSECTAIYVFTSRRSACYLPPTRDNDSGATKAILIFVHGDGAMTYDAHGYYELYWNALREQGYAIFSWDKPGVGDSQGNWLQQSMQDRQSEVLAAIDFTRTQLGFDASNTGLIGFSQAGWVVPVLAQQADNIAFAIGIGFATNWLEQGRYYAIQEANNEELDDTQLPNALKEYEQSITSLKKHPSYEEYLHENKGDAMSQERFEFVFRNFQADASLAYQKVAVPMLLIWGQEDLNVDAQHEYIAHKKAPHPLIDVQLIPKASHGLLNSDDFNEQKFGISAWIKMMWQGEDALAPSALSTITDWLATQAVNTSSR